MTSQPPRDTSVADAARRAARDAKLALSRGEAVRKFILGRLRYGCYSTSRLYNASPQWVTRSYCERTLAELQREGRIVHGPQGWSLK
jgi:hypothetical protein